jgi:glycosyltransferase involved in cell wall biosynthesis
MSSQTLPLSVVIPTYDELATLQTVIGKVQSSLGSHDFEIVIVDDGSTDGTAEFLRDLEDTRIRVLSHGANRGKGAALRTAFREARGEVVVIQDADLEYDPADIPALIQPIVEGRADVVFGSRFNSPAQHVPLYWQRVANSWLTWFSNRINKLDLSDMETGYKAFRKSVLERVNIRENRFGVEPELTAKTAKMKCRICEVPISYRGRNYHEGKKIGFRDALRAAWCIVRYRIAD